MVEVQMSTPKESKSSEKGSKISVTAPKRIEECLGVQMIDLTAIPDMAFTKPVELAYFGNEIQENSWCTVYADLCKQLIDDYPKILKQFRKDSMSGTTKVWLVDDAHTELLAASKWVMRNYHIETNCSAHDIVRAIKWLLDRVPWIMRMW